MGGTARKIVGRASYSNAASMHASPLVQRHNHLGALKGPSMAPLKPREQTGGSFSGLVAYVDQR